MFLCALAGVALFSVIEPSYEPRTETKSVDLGDVSAPGFNRRDGGWVNDSYGTSPVTLHLDIRGGLGQIRLSSEG